MVSPPGQWTGEGIDKVHECTIKKFGKNNNEVNFGLLQIRSTLIGTGIPSPATLLFIRPIRTLLTKIGREAINISEDDEHYKPLKSRQETYIKNNDSHMDSTFFP